MKQRCDVLQEDVARSYFANDPGHFSPESASFAFEAQFMSAVADVLARESA
jgi:hypothetical protein